MPKTETSADLSELSREVCEALEPKPCRQGRIVPGLASSKGLWQASFGGRSTWNKTVLDWKPRSFHEPDVIRAVEALLRQDPARKERYAEELVREIGGNKSFSSGIVDLALFEVFDIATATPEQRLRAAHRALRGE